MFVMAQQGESGENGFLRMEIKGPLDGGASEGGENVGVVIECDGVIPASGAADKTGPREQNMVMLFHERKRRPAEQGFSQDHSSSKLSNPRRGRRSERRPAGTYPRSRCSRLRRSS